MMMMELVGELGSTSAAVTNVFSLVSILPLFRVPLWTQEVRRQECDMVSTLAGSPDMGDSGLELREASIFARRVESS